MRLFVAVEPTPELVRWAAETAARLAPLSSGLRWLPAENAHLTLAFLGETPDARVGVAREAVAAAARDRPRFTLELAGLGAFDSWRRVKVVWAGVKGGADSLRGLAESVRAELESRGFGLERREFSSHLTLARSRDGRPEPALEQASLPPAPSVPVEAIALVKSERGSRSSRYEPLERFPLKQ
ncbi:MAG: RNA 2',3'-cyclic phosphodiesterase [Elusimicrobia bacterium]|nr:RNA 2',3'-cyclic phosphodiesterase [Elusimicrobiota bacterium]